MASHRYKKNHSRKRAKSHTSFILQLTTTAAALYGTYQLASWVWKTYMKKDDEDDEYDKNDKNDKNEKEESFQSKIHTSFYSSEESQRKRNKCRSEIMMAMKEFLPTLKKSIQIHTDCSHETKALKSLRASKKEIESDIQSHPMYAEYSKTLNIKNVSNNESFLILLQKKENMEMQENELWERIKIQTMTKMISTLYSHVLMFLVLTIQIHLLGHQLHNMVSQNIEDIQKHQQSHALVLQQTYKYFFEMGISQLCHTIRQIIQSCNPPNSTLIKSPFTLNCWNITNTDGITKDQFMDGIDYIRQCMENSKSSTSSTNSNINPISLLVSFIVQPDTLPKTQNPLDMEAQTILNQTWDIIESPIFDKALKECIDCSYQNIQINYWDSLFHDFTNEIPLIQIITQLKHSSSSFFTKPYDHENPINIFSSPMYPNQYLSMLENLSGVLHLGEVCYES